MNLSAGLERAVAERILREKLLRCLRAAAGKTVQIRIPSSRIRSADIGGDRGLGGYTLGFVSGILGY